MNFYTFKSKLDSLLKFYSQIKIFNWILCTLLNMQDCSLAPNKWFVYLRNGTSCCTLRAWAKIQITPTFRLYEYPIFSYFLISLTLSDFMTKTLIDFRNLVKFLWPVQCTTWGVLFYYSFVTQYLCVQTQRHLPVKTLKREISQNYVALFSWKK